MSEGFIKLLGIMCFSGLIAYIGDQVGFKMGKRKIHVFGLRPRQTATLITVSFGVIITLITIIFASILSEDVRVALFRIEEIKSSIRLAAEENRKLMLENEKALKSVKELNTDIIERKQEITELRKFYSELKQSVIIISVNEIIAHVIIEKNTSYEEVVEKFKQLFTDSYQAIKSKGIKTHHISKILKEYDSEIKEKARIIADQPVRFLLQTKASSNLTLNSGAGNIYDIVAISETKIINSGEKIESPFYVDGNWDIEAIYNTVNIFFNQVEEYLKIKKAFVYGDYFVHPSEIHDISAKIKETGSRIYLRVTFNKNIYSLGPFSFQIEFVPAENKVEDDEKTEENKENSDLSKR